MGYRSTRCACKAILDFLVMLWRVLLVERTAIFLGKVLTMTFNEAFDHSEAIHDVENWTQFLLFDHSFHHLALPSSAEHPSSFRWGPAHRSEELAQLTYHISLYAHDPRKFLEKVSTKKFPGTTEFVFCVDLIPTRKKLWKDHDIYIPVGSYIPQFFQPDVQHLKPVGGMTSPEELREFVFGLPMKPSFYLTSVLDNLNDSEFPRFLAAGGAQAHVTPGFPRCCWNFCDSILRDCMGCYTEFHKNDDNSPYDYIDEMMDMAGWLGRWGHMRHTLRHMTRRSVLDRFPFRTAFIWASVRGNFDVLRELVQECSIHNTIVDIGRVKGRDIMLCAIASGRMDVVKYLHRQGFRLFNDCVVIACESGHADILDWLLEHPWRSCGNTFCAMSNLPEFDLPKFEQPRFTPYHDRFQRTSVESARQFFVTQVKRYMTDERVFLNIGMEAVVEAARNGHINCLEVLYRYAVPKSAIPLKMAGFFGVEFTQKMWEGYRCPYKNRVKAFRVPVYQKPHDVPKDPFDVCARGWLNWFYVERVNDRLRDTLTWFLENNFSVEANQCVLLHDDCVLRAVSLEYSMDWVCRNCEETKTWGVAIRPMLTKMMRDRGWFQEAAVSGTP